MSRLNPNAGAFVPSFSMPAVVPAAAAAPAKTPAKSGKPAPIVTAPESQAAPPAVAAAASAKAQATPSGKATAAALAMPAAEAVATTPDDVDMEPDSDRLTYPIEYLLQFQPICDTVPCYFPDVVRAPPPQRIGRYINDRLVYSVPELLHFQPLYQMFPPDLEWSDALATVVESMDKKVQTPVKQTKKEKAKAKAAAAAAATGVDQLQYDPTLMCYFNPTEYAAALSMAAYGSSTPSGDKAATAGGPSISPNGKPTAIATNPVEEAVFAKRRLASLLDDVSLESVPTILQSFEDLEITCTHTLQEVISQLFDRAIAEPQQCDAYAQLCSGMAERTPEFKEGAKTINFRRILLTRCYEALIEEPETPSYAQTGRTSNAATLAGPAQHSWRRQCMLQNVCFVGELFRRQLLTENIMHVCVAMMLEDEVNPQMDVIDAACRLLMLVGDLLDGSSPASRRTMDEYFDVLQRLSEHVEASEPLKETIAEMTSVRAAGWAKKRLEMGAGAGSPLKPTISTSATLVATGVAASAAVASTPTKDGATVVSVSESKSS